MRPRPRYRRHRASIVSSEDQDLDQDLPQSIDDLDWDNVATSTITVAPRMERPSDHYQRTLPTGRGWQEWMRDFLTPTAIQPIGSALRKGRTTRQGGELIPLGAKACAPGVLAYGLPRGVKRGDEGMRQSDTWRWLPLDLDKVGLPVSDAWEIVEDALSDHKMASYSTWSCRDGQASIRILIPLSRAATFDEVCSLWWWARRRLADAGLPDGDYTSTGPALDPRLDARLFYLPAVPRTGTIGEEGWGGVQPSGFVSDDSTPLLDVNAVLVEARECEAVDRPGFAERWPRVPLPGGSRRGPGVHTSSSKTWTGSGSGGGGAVHTEWCDFGTVPFEGTTLKAWALEHVTPGTWTSVDTPWREDECWGVRGKALTLHHELDGRLWAKDWRTGICHRHCVGIGFSLTPWTTGLKTVDLTPEALTELLADDEVEVEVVSQEEVARLEAKRLKAVEEARREREADERDRAEDEAEARKSALVEVMRREIDAANVADDLERRRQLEGVGGGGLPHAVCTSLEDDNDANSQDCRELYERSQYSHTAPDNHTKSHISEEVFASVERVIADLDKSERLMGCRRAPSVHIASKRRASVTSTSTSCWAWTCDCCGPRLRRATKAAANALFQDRSAWAVVLLRFQTAIPEKIEAALRRWRKAAPEHRTYVGAATAPHLVEILLAWNPILKDGSDVEMIHAPRSSKTQWVDLPDGTQELVHSGTLLYAALAGEGLSCGLPAAFADLMDRVDLKAWAEGTGAYSCILRGSSTVTKGIINLRDGALSRLKRSSRQAPKGQDVLEDGIIFARSGDVDGDDEPVRKPIGSYIRTYHQTGHILETARSLFPDVVILEERRDAGQTEISWGQPVGTPEEDLVPATTILDAVVHVAKVEPLRRKRREPLARFNRALDEHVDETGSAVFSMDLKVRPWRRRPKGEQIRSE